MDDGFTQLEHDHRAIEDQFQIFVRDNEDPVVRELCEQLTRHATLEETLLHPALRRWVDGGDDLADRAQQELSTIGTMVAELSDSSTPERLGDLVGQLHEIVSAHFQFVDSEIIPEMRELGVQPLAS
jgi:hemerythrin superfamily protein